MQIVIDISEKEYQYVLNCKDSENLLADDLASIILRGTVLPEHHGRLIDINQVGLSGIDSTNLPLDKCVMCYLKEDIDETPTIIDRN